MIPYVYGVFVGAPLVYYQIPGGEYVLIFATIWLTLGQMNLYRRVNELTRSAKDYLFLEYNTESPEGNDGRMLYEWWAVLPPPFNVLVALRQIYFLSEYWRIVRGEPPTKDYIAEDIFPSIGERRRYTVAEFMGNPQLWYWFMRPRGGGGNNRFQNQQGRNPTGPFGGNNNAFGGTMPNNNNNNGNRGGNPFQNQSQQQQQFPGNNNKNNMNSPFGSNSSFGAPSQTPPEQQRFLKNDDPTFGKDIFGNTDDRF